MPCRPDATHHYACACREEAHLLEVSKLKRERGEAWEAVLREALRAMLTGAAVAFGIIALGEWARRTAAASFAYRRETPLGPSPDFYCEACDVFDIEPHPLCAMSGPLRQ